MGGLEVLCWSNRGSQIHGRESMLKSWMSKRNPVNCLLLYEETSHIDSANKTHRQMFWHKCKTTEAIPPTQSALLQQVRRTACQVGIWPPAPSQEAWGWTKRAGLGPLCGTHLFPWNQKRVEEVSLAMHRAVQMQMWQIDTYTDKHWRCLKYFCAVLMSADTFKTYMTAAAFLDSVFFSPHFNYFKLEDILLRQKGGECSKIISFWGSDCCCSNLQTNKQKLTFFL